MATERKGMSIAEFEAGLFDMSSATEYWNFLLYGDSGCGKTFLTGSLPDRVLWLAGEPGYITAASEGAQGVVRIIPDPATAAAALAWLEGGAARKFDWIVPDGITTMQSKFLLEYAAEAWDANPAKRSRAGRNLPDKPDYYNAQNAIKSLVARLVDLPCNVLFTGHAMRPEDENGETLVYPGIQGKGYEVSNYVSGLMHGVWYMKNTLVERDREAVQTRRLLFRQYVDPANGTRYFANDKTKKLPMFLTVRDEDNPDGVMMPDILEIINGKSSPGKAKKSTRKARG